jgi:type II secretory pathway component PulC
MFANGPSLSISLLLIGCLSAASLLVVQWFNPPSADEYTFLPNQNMSEFEATPVQPFQVAPLNNYRTIIERPLFLADRRAPAEAPEETSVSETPVGDEDFVLLGVVLTPDANMALLQIDRGGRFARLKVGERVNGWELQSVQANQVSLNNGERELDLPLLRNQQPGASRSRQSRTNRQQNHRAAQPQFEEDYLESDIPPPYR